MYIFFWLSQFTQYWPNEFDVAQVYDDITVTLKKLESMKGLIIRQFIVRKANKVQVYLITASVFLNGRISSTQLLRVNKPCQLIRRYS